MATNEMVSQLVEVRNELELGMDIDPVAESRMHVFRNVAGHWAVSGLQLPESLEVPGVLMYESIDDLVNPCPVANAGVTYHGYTKELDDAVSSVLKQFDPSSEMDVLTSGTAHAITHEASQRLSGYVDILLALGKPKDRVLELLEAALLEHDRATEDLHNTMSASVRSADEIVATLRLRGTFLTRMLINYERHTTEDIIAGKPISTGLISPKQDGSDWRNKLRGLFGRA